MKLAHLADLHLGFRQFARQTPQGINQREADVAGAFRRALDAVIAAAPDLVVVAGDLFHSVRPTNAAILDSFNQFRRLRERLPQAPVVLVAGNHDTPRSVETGSILRLFEAIPGVHAVALEARRLTFDDLGCTVLGVPHAAQFASPRPALDPDPRAAVNILVMHGEVAGVLPQTTPALEYGGALIDPADLRRGGWDYVALGHYHVATRVAPHAWYSGSLEYVSTNPWGEAREQGAAERPGRKGWLLATLGRGAAEVAFQPLEPARRVIDLEPIQGAGLDAEALSREIVDRARRVRGGLTGQIVRQVVYDVPRVTARELDHAAIRDLKATALQYQLDLRRPPPSRQVGVGAPGRRQTLPELVAEYLSRRPLPAEVDRERFVALGRGYVEEVEHDLLDGEGRDS